MPSLKQRAENARAAAGKAEADRVAANVKARDLAAIAADLEGQLDEVEREKIYAKHGEPVLAPLNRELSSDEELQAARERGVF